MKNKLFIHQLFIISALVCFSCTNEAKKEKESIYKEAREKVKYQCPAKCEGDKTCEEQMRCPKCNGGMEVIVEAPKKK